MSSAALAAGDLPDHTVAGRSDSRSRVDVLPKPLAGERDLDDRSVLAGVAALLQRRVDRAVEDVAPSDPLRAQSSKF